MKKNIFFCLLFTFVLISVVSAFANYENRTEAYQGDMDQESLLGVFNMFRKQGAHCGRQYHEPLILFTWSDQLAHVAQLYSNALHANRNNQAFARSGGFDLQGALQYAGYDYVNLYQSQARLTSSYTEEAYVLWLMDNEGACNNIMDARYTEIGVVKTELF